MPTMKKLEQGITDFKEYIDNDCYFVDKTHLISHLIDHVSKVHLITRPRPFWKNFEPEHDPLLLRGPFPNSGLTSLPMRIFLTIFPSPNIPNVLITWGSIRLLP